MGPIKKYVTCIMTFSTSFNFTLPLSLYYSLNFIQKLQNESCIYGCFSVSRLSKEVENHIFKHSLIFRHLCTYKQRTLTNQWNCNILVQMLYSYFRCSGSFFLDVLFLLLAVILSELHEKPRRKEELQKKSAKKNLL